MGRVAEDMSLEACGQIAQVLAQIDATLGIIQSDRTWLLQVLIYIADEHDGPVLNEIWDAGFRSTILLAGPWCRSASGKPARSRWS